MEMSIKNMSCLVMVFFMLNGNFGKKPLTIINFDDPSAFEEFTYAGPDPGAVTVSSDICSSDDSEECASEGIKARWIEWNLKEDQWYGWGVQLGGLDTKGMKYLTFSVRGELGGERFLIKIRDTNGIEIGFSSSAYQEITRQYKEVIVPLQDFTNANKNFDLNSLENINFGFNVVSATKKGKIYFDNLRIEPKLVYGMRSK